MKTCCTHVLSWICPPPKFNKRLREACKQEKGIKERKKKEKKKKDGVSKASSETGELISYAGRSRKKSDAKKKKMLST